MLTDLKCSMIKLPLAIVGSSRKNGDTHHIVSALFEGRPLDKLDLLDLKIYPYNYDGIYPPDDQFQEVVQAMLTHDRIIFATPVYWYAMSGPLKILFDRLTDIVTINKEIGRQMKDKETYLVAVGAEELLPEGFEVPFESTSRYFKMKYRGSYYCRTKELHAVPLKDDLIQLIYRDTAAK